MDKKFSDEWFGLTYKEVLNRIVLANSQMISIVSKREHGLLGIETADDFLAVSYRDEKKVFNEGIEVIRYILED